MLQFESIFFFDSFFQCVCPTCVSFPSNSAGDVQRPTRRCVVFRADVSLDRSTVTDDETGHESRAPFPSSVGFVPWTAWGRWDDTGSDFHTVVLLLSTAWIDRSDDRGVSIPSPPPSLATVFTPL